MLSSEFCSWLPGIQLRISQIRRAFRDTNASSDAKFLHFNTGLDFCPFFENYFIKILYIIYNFFYLIFNYFFKFSILQNCFLTRSFQHTSPFFENSKEQKVVTCCDVFHFFDSQNLHFLALLSEFYSDSHQIFTRALFALMRMQ